MTKCNKCAGDLPHGAYGMVKCEYCGTINNVPTPEQEREKKIEAEEASGRKWISIAVIIIILGIAGSVAAFVPLISVEEEYQDTVTEIVREKYTVYETKIEKVPRQETYTEQVPKTVMKTITKEVPITEEKTVYVDVPYEELETKAVSWTVDWYTIDSKGNYKNYLGRETFSSTFNKDWGSGTLYNIYDNYVGFKASTKIRLIKPKKITFGIGSDDSSRLQLDGNEIIDNGGAHSFKTKSTTVYLTSGEHNLLYLYREYTGNAAAYFSSNGMIWEEMVTKYRSVPTTKTVSITKTVTEEVPVTEYETVTKTRTVYDDVQREVPVTKYRDVPKEKTVTKTKTVQKTLLEYLLTEPWW